MPLTIYRRHTSDCPHKKKGRRWHRCDCPVWVQGSLGGEYVRESLNVTVWGAAQERVRGWEASGQVGVIRYEIPTIEEAVQKHIADAEARNLKPESVKKIKDVIERRLLNYCGRDQAAKAGSLSHNAVRAVADRCDAHCRAHV
jgi:hypothetical protein